MEGIMDALVHLVNRISALENRLHTSYQPCLATVKSFEAMEAFVARLERLSIAEPSGEPMIEINDTSALDPLSDETESDDDVWPK